MTLDTMTATRPTYTVLALDKTATVIGEVAPTPDLDQACASAASILALDPDVVQVDVTTRDYETVRTFTRDLVAAT